MNPSRRTTRVLIVIGKSGSALLAVVTDSLNGAAFHCFRAKSYFLISLGLFANEGNTIVIIACKEFRCGITAKVTVDAVAVDIELTGDIFFCFFVDIGHNVYGDGFPLPYFPSFFHGMQLFFVATGNFSGQNRLMQDQNPENSTKKMSPLLKKVICIGAAVCSCLAVLGATYLFLYRDLPTANHRYSGLNFPCKIGNQTIASIKAEWKNARGMSRIAYKADYYPSITVTLGDEASSGTLFFRLATPNGGDYGEFVTLVYENGKFLEKNDRNLKASGKTATFYVEGGVRQSDLIAMELDDSHPLWTLRVWKKTDKEATESYAGYLTLPYTTAE